MSEQNHYAVLGVPHDASHHEIQRAYHRKAREVHPDRHANDPALVEPATAAMSAVNEAWRVLGDVHRKQEYDSTLARTAQLTINRTNRRNFDYGSAPTVILYLVIAALMVPLIKTLSDSGTGVKLLWVITSLVVTGTVITIWYVLRDMGR